MQSVWHQLDYVLFAGTALALLTLLHFWLWREGRGGRIAIAAWVLVAAVLANGWFLVNAAGHRERLGMEQRVAGYAPTYAREMEVMGHEKITGETDPTSADYQRMIDAEKRWLAVNPTVNDIYTLRRLPDGKLGFMVDSETDYNHNGVFDEEREQRTKIGEPYESELVPVIERALGGHAAFMEDVYTDRWGTWVSAIVPLRDQTGKVDAVLGVDFDASTWIESIRKARLEEIGYLGCYLLVVAGGSALITGQITRRDLLAKVREQDAARLQQRKLETLVNSIEGIVWECDVDTFRFTFVSRQCERVLGYTPEEWMACPTFWADKLHPDDKWALNYCREMVARKGSYACDYRMVAADGRTVWIRASAAVLLDDSGVPVLERGVFHDITEQHRAEEALRESQERFRQISENICEVFWMTSPDWEELLYVSPAYEQIWGRTCSSAYERPGTWFEAVLPVDRALVVSGLERQGRGESSEMEFRITRPDGTLRWIRSRGFPVYDEARKLQRVVGLSADITERKNADAAFEHVNRQLCEASREAGMAEVATNVLHNVGNVLNSVNVSATLAIDHVRQSSAPNLDHVVTVLRERAADLGTYLTTDPIGRQLPGFLAQLSEQFKVEQQTLVSELEQLGKNVEHMKEIVCVQQSYAGVAGITETVSIIDLIEDSLRINAGALARHDVRLVREFEAKPVIDVDKHKVVQILVNLIRNAKYACDDARRADKRLTIRVTNGSEFVRIGVTDNGIGIPPENLTRVFSHGFTTRKGGHGFGLHSGALAAHEMGGTLLAHSDGPGCGATFTLELPLQPPG